MARTVYEQIASKKGQELATLILRERREDQLWAKLLQSKDENIVLKALIYLSDRAYGKAMQAVTVEQTGGHKFGFDIPAKPDNTSEAIQ